MVHCIKQIGANHMRIETVKIKDSKDSFIIINKSDFDKDKHVLFKEKSENKQHDKKPSKKNDKG